MMADILKDLQNASIDLWMHQPKCSDEELYKLLCRAIVEIEHLRKANADMGWSLNPDRSGGQFTQEEIDWAQARAGGDGW
jgi:hypothetical protein